jgi:ABC-type branched-subunit amino acid transport system ATPase component
MLTVIDPNGAVQEAQKNHRFGRHNPMPGFIETEKNQTMQARSSEKCYQGLFYWDQTWNSLKRMTLRKAVLDGL